MKSGVPGGQTQAKGTKATGPTLKRPREVILIDAGEETPGEGGETEELVGAWAPEYVKVGGRGGQETGRFAEAARYVTTYRHNQGFRGAVQTWIRRWPRPEWVD